MPEDAAPVAVPVVAANRSTLHFVHRVGYGLGHIYNDLCAAVWFSYTLLFLQKSLDIPATVAGCLLMVGQVGDAIATPCVGLLSDRFGTKRGWHAAGTLLVLLTFPMLFSLCPWCSEAGAWWPPVYFGFFIVLFQIAWPIVQVAHLAIISELSVTARDRSDLTSIRYSASIVANIVVYVVTWVFLGQHDGDHGFGHEDRYRIRDIVLILTLVGVTMSVLFHFSLSFSGYERRRLRHAPPDAAEDDTEKLLPAATTRSFLRSPLLYQYGFLYVFARLFMTTALVYMPLWLNERLVVAGPSPGPAHMLFANRGLFTAHKVEYLATVPLVSFLASFLSASVLKAVNHRLPQPLAYAIGSALSVVGPLAIYLVKSDDFSPVLLFTIAAFFGAGSSITMVSSMCLIADLIGNNKQKGGFVYSAVTFADKLITGIIIVIIESLKCDDHTKCPTYYKKALSSLCFAASLLGFVVLLSLRCSSWRRQRRERL